MSRIGKSFLAVLVFACAALTASTHAQIVINEIHYNPGATGSLPNAEFVELYNAGPTAVNMAGWSMADAFVITFTGATTIPSHGYLVVAKDPAVLQSTTGYAGALQWNVVAGAPGQLSDGGELITLNGPSFTDTFTYDDVAPWPTAPDGSGKSLELLNPALDNSQGASWGASTGNHGTPGAQNSIFTNAATIQSESPTRRTAVASLPTVSVTFSASVTGVTASSLTVGGSASTTLSCPSCVAGAGAGPYIFSGYASPATGSVTIALAAGGSYAGDSWTVSIGIVAVINELHYHPFDVDADAEYLEIYNAGGSVINMSGWTFTSGIVGTVPGGTNLPAGGYVVFAKVPALVQARTGYAGAIAWTSGSLSNGGETVSIADTAGNVIDSVPYSDSGTWPTPPDGDGPSAELINPAMPNQFGGAWRSSTGNWGTPGAQNSTFVAAPPPIINGAKHTPLLPLPNEAITVTALVLDDGVSPPTVTLYYRQDFDPTIAYNSTPMLDDGAHGDGAAGDGTFGANVPGLPDGARLDFTIRADDGTNVSAGPSGNNTLVAGENPAQTYLCKFSNAPASTDLPHYHLITTQHTRALQDAHNENEYDGTFVHCNAANGGCVLFYNVVERYRGQSSLNQHPHSYRVNFPASSPLQSEMGFPIKKLNTMSQMGDRQGLGYQFFREAFGHAVPTHMSQFIRYSTAPLSHGGTPDFACANVEAEDADMMESQGGVITPLRFPSLCTVSLATCSTTADCGALGGTCFERTSGNLYKGVLSAELQYLGTNPASYQPQYEKQTNETDGIYTDVMDLTRALDPDTTNDANFEAAVNAMVDEDEWTKYFAINMLLVNQEGGIYRDTGDDFLVYFEPPGSPLGPNAKLMPRDMDSVFGGFGTFAQETIWRTNIQTPQRFIRNNAYAGRFVGAICDLLNADFTPAVMNPRIDALPDSIANATQKQNFKNWVVARIAYVNNEITRTTTLTGVPASPYQAASPVINLSGQLNQCGTYRVTVNGAPISNYSVFNHTWSASYTLVPGPNQITVRSVDVNGVVLDQATASVVYDPPVAPTNLLRLVMPKRMVNDKTLTLRADILDSAGRIITTGCFDTLGTVTVNRVSDNASIPITVTIFDNHLPVPDDSIRFYHGVGSVSFTLDSGAAVPAGDYRVTVTVGTLTLSKIVTVVSNPTWRVMPSSLSGADLVWGPDENIRISSHLTDIPNGSTLTINPGTLIMVDTTGSLEDGTLIDISGQLNAVGTQDKPIHFFSERGPAAMIHTVSGSLSNADAWRGINFLNGGSSTAKWIFLTGAGNGVVTSHPRPPVISLQGTHNLVVEDSVFVDSTGMMFQSPGTGTYAIRRSLISRVGIGAEFLSSGHTVVVEDSWWTGIGRGPTSPLRYDGDGIHVDGGGSNQTIRRCIIADIGDDGIDHSNSNFLVEDTIIHDINDKATSLTGGSGTFRNSLIFNAPNGIRGTARVYNTTIASGAPIATPQEVQESIIWPNSIPTCTGNTDYTIVGSAGDLGCGTGNQSVNPQFANTGQCDYNPTAGSPALTAGPTGGRIGWLGFPTATACSVNSQCDDANGCTVDTCSLGVCNFRAIAGCGLCNTNADCSDGNACTTEICGPLGTCQASQPLSCDDANACTTDTCDTLLGCQHTSPSCDDGNACTTDTCVPATGCQHGTTNCDDANACTIDSCIPATGCQHTSPSCDDGNPCTNDSCVPASGCAHANNTASCNDGSLCTTGDVCASGTCGGTAVVCPGGSTCSPATGQCVAGPVNTSFQDGVNSYGGTQDTYLAEAAPTTVEGALDNWRWDTENPAPSQEFGLIRFDNIIGSGAGQIPAGSTITNATLTLVVTNNGVTPNGNVNESVVDWSETVATWNNFDGDAGVQADEYLASPAYVAPIATGTVTITVTASVQAWASGLRSNFGWVFRPANNDGVQVNSAENATIASRPKLTVDYTAPATSCTTNGDCSDNNACNGIETCVSTVCQPGTALNCDDTNVCTTDSCAPVGGCGHVNNTVACSDGNACTTNDTCAGGACVGGAAPNCDDSNPCTNDSCNTSSGCVHANNTASCSDGNLCTTADVCAGGTCGGTPVSCPGGQTCNPGTGTCQSGPTTVTFQQGFSGYSGSADTFIDTLLGSQATVSPIVVDSDPSVEQALLKFDGIFGTGPGQIPAGSTVSSATLTLWSGAGANDQSANPVNLHLLLHAWSDAGVWAAYGVAPWNASGGIQNDGVDALIAVAATTTIATAATSAALNVTTSLQAWAAAPSSNFGWAILPTGTDGLRLESNESTTASNTRRPLLSVTFTPPAVGCTINQDCSDNDACNGIETCVANVCQPGTAPNCDDGNVCTTDSCSAIPGCQHANNTIACTDNNACTTNDTCAGGSCVGGVAPNCNDGNVCTDDSCNTVTGCVHASNAASCADALFCNGVEFCSGGACQPGAAVNCDDGVPCSTDSCNESTDSCEHTACTVTVAAAGSRWLAVTPPAGLASVALRVTTPGLACLPKYVDALGALTSSPVFQSSAQWGTVHVGDRPIVPSTAYTVQAEVTPGTPIATGTATTWGWGNANNVDDVNVFDTICVLDGFQGIFTQCTPFGVDQNSGVLAHPATIDLDDILAVLDAFSGVAYPDADPCSGGFTAPGGSTKAESRMRSVAAPKIWLEPSVKAVAPGETVRIDVLAQGLVDVRGYQIAVQAKGGTSGALVPGAVTIATFRNDYLFKGEPVSAVTDPSGLRLAGAIREGGTTSSGVVYLGSFEYRVSPDAAGTFSVHFRSQDTMFRDSTNAAEGVDAGARLDITIGSSPSTGPMPHVSGDLSVPIEGDSR